MMDSHGRYILDYISKFNQITQLISQLENKSETINKIIDIIHTDSQFGKIALLHINYEQGIVSIKESRGFLRDEIATFNPRINPADIKKYIYKSRILFPSIDVYKIPGKDMQDPRNFLISIEKEYPGEWDWTSSDRIFIPLKDDRDIIIGIFMLSDPLSKEALSETILSLYFHFTKQITSTLLNKEIDTESIVTDRQILKEQSEIEELMEFSRVGYYVINTSGVLIRANHTFLDLLGYRSIEEINDPGPSKTIFLSPHDLNSFIENILNKKDVIDQKLRLKRRDETLISVQNKCKLIANESGALNYIEGYIRDISVARELSEKLLISEGKCQMILESIQRAILILDEEGTINYANDAFIELVKAQDADLHNQRIDHFLIPTTGRQNWELLLETWFEDDMPPIREDLKFTIISDNSQLNTQVFGNFFINYDKTSRLILCINDMTSEKISDIEKEKNKLFLESLVNHPQIPILTVDHKGIIKYFNKGMENLSGFKQEDIGNNTSFTDILEDKARNLAAINAAIAENRFFRKRSLLLLKSGDYLDVELSISPLSRLKDETQQAVIFFSDITSQVLLEKNQIRLAASIHSSLDGMALLDRSLEITLANKTFAELYGMKVEEIVGKNLFDLWARHGTWQIRDPLIQGLKDKGYYRSNVDIRLEDVGYRVYDIAVHTIKTSDTNIEIGFLAVTRDVTEEEIQKIRLNKLSLQLNSYGEIAVKAIKTRGGSTLYKDICKTIERISDFKNSAIIIFNNEKPYYTIHQSELDHRINLTSLFELDVEPKELIRDVQNGLKLGDITYAIDQNGDKPILYDFSIWLFILLKDETDKAIGLLCVGEGQLDEMPQKDYILPLEVLAAELSLVIEVTKLEESVNLHRKEMEEFVYSVSHDLKTPLMSIIGFSDILKEQIINRLGAEEQHYFNRIEANILVLNSMVKDLLQLARASKLPTAKDYIDLSVFIQNIKEEFENTIDTKINIRIENDLPVVSYDPTGIKITFSNLLSNSYKFRDQNRDLLIEIGSFSDMSKHTIYFRDNGIGINPAEKERIFEPFTRLHGKEIEGTGMGLAIVKKIVVSRGGSVWCESEPGNGMTVYFTIPIENR